MFESGGSPVLLNGWVRGGGRDGIALSQQFITITWVGDGQGILVSQYMVLTGHVGAWAGSERWDYCHNVLQVLYGRMGWGWLGQSLQMFLVGERGQVSSVFRIMRLSLMC